MLHLNLDLKAQTPTSQTSASPMRAEPAKIPVRIRIHGTSAAHGNRMSSPGAAPSVGVKALAEGREAGLRLSHRC